MSLKSLIYTFLFSHLLCCKTAQRKEIFQFLGVVSSEYWRSQSSVLLPSGVCSTDILPPKGSTYIAYISLYYCVLFHSVDVLEVL